MDATILTTYGDSATYIHYVNFGAMSQAGHLTIAEHLTIVLIAASTSVHHTTELTQALSNVLIEHAMISASTAQTINIRFTYLVTSQT